MNKKRKPKKRRDEDSIAQNDETINISSNTIPREVALPQEGEKRDISQDGQDVSMQVQKKKRKRKEKKEDHLNSFSQVIEPEQLKNSAINIKGSSLDYDTIISTIKTEKKRKTKAVKQELEEQIDEIIDLDLDFEG